MKRKLLSILLTLCMVLTLLPTVALAEGETHAGHCVCGATHSAVGNHTTDESSSTTWQAWPESGLPTEGNYYLTDNVTISSEWKIEYGKNVVLCLNGKTLTADNATVPDTILIEGTLTITDCKGTGIITGTNTSTTGNRKAIVVSALYSDCTLNLYGGKITGINSGEYAGAGVHNEGIFNMYGGEISGNTAPYGSGVDNFKNASYSGPAIFNFYGGSIKDSIQNRSSSTINANGGTVAGEVINDGTITTAEGYTGTTFSGEVMNSTSGTISGGSYSGEVHNSGTVSGSITNNGILYNYTAASGTITATLSGSGNVATVSESSSGLSVTWKDNSGADVTNVTATASSADALEFMVSDSNVSTINLGADVTLDESIDINRVVTINLNGHDITFGTQNKRFEVSGGTLNLTGSGTVAEKYPNYAPVHIRGSNDPEAAYNTVVNVGKDVTLQGWAGIMIDRNSVQDHNYAYGVQVTVNGTLNGVNDTSGYSGAGVYINGQVQESTGNVPLITLSSTSKVSGSGYAIYAAGYAKWTLAGTISGNGGVEAKAGIFDITGGSITATAASTTHERDDSGSSTTGYGIAAVDNAGYAGNPTITIGNCAVTGAVAIVDDDDDPANDRATISITGGTFSADPSAYVAEGYEVAQANGKWTVSRIPDPAPVIIPIPVTPSSSSASVTVPVSSASGAVEVKASVSSGTASIEISDKQIEQVAANGSGMVTVDVSKLEKVESVSVPAHVVDTTNKAEDTGLTVALPSGSVSLDETALESVSTGKDVAVSVKRVPATDLNEAQQKAVGDMANIGLVVDVDMLVGGTKQSSFNGGKLTISIPYTPKRGEDISKLTVWFIRDDGTIENKGGYYDAVKGCFVFETSHLSRYLLVSVNVQFSDVPTSAYYAAAVNWAVAQGITTGTTDTTFGPDLSCTRAQIVTFLYRCAVAQGVDVSVGADTNILSYTDALELPEYAFEAFQWTCGAGIIQGADGKLMPGDDCTRAQIVTMLYRYAVATGADVSVGADTNILSYADALELPEYAFEAFQWACGAGIIQGADGKLMPNGTCTRAQIVTMLYRANG